jgi:hypothetical protein
MEARIDELPALFEARNVAAQHGDVWLTRGGEAAGDGFGKFHHDELVSDFRRPRIDEMQAAVAHGVFLLTEWF